MKLEYDKLLSSLAFNFNLRRSIKEKVMPDAGSAAAGSSASYPGAEANWPAVGTYTQLTSSLCSLAA